MSIQGTKRKAAEDADVDEHGNRVRSTKLLTPKTSEQAKSMAGFISSRRTSIDQIEHLYAQGAIDQVCAETAIELVAQSGSVCVAGYLCERFTFKTERVARALEVAIRSEHVGVFDVLATHYNAFKCARMILTLCLSLLGSQFPGAMECLDILMSKPYLPDHDSLSTFMYCLFLHSDKWAYIVSQKIVLYLKQHPTLRTLEMRYYPREAIISGHVEYMKWVIDENLVSPGASWLSIVENRAAEMCALLMDYGVNAQCIEEYVATHPIKKITEIRAYLRNRLAQRDKLVTATTPLPLEIAAICGDYHTLVGEPSKGI